MSEKQPHPSIPGWSTLCRPLKASELASWLMENPDDIVFVPVPEYSTYDTLKLVCVFLSQEIPE